MDNQKVEGYLMVVIDRALVARALTLRSGLGQYGNKCNKFLDGDGDREKNLCAEWRS